MIRCPLCVAGPEAAFRRCLPLLQATRSGTGRVVPIVPAPVVVRT